MTPHADLHDLLIRSVVDYAIYMLDPHGCVISWNPGAERIKGYSADEIMGLHFSCFYTQEDRSAGVPSQALKTAAETDRFAAEGWRLRKDGTRFWAAVVIDAIRQHGQLVGFVKITRDMTEQREAYLAALESERRFRLLVQGVTDYAIFMLDPDGHVTNWNTGAARIKGYSQSEIIGQHFSRFYTPDDLEARAPWTALEKARREGHYEAEGWRVRKDGTHFWASVVVDALHDDDGKLIGFAKVTRDLTERRETQLQLEQSREQLFQSQKMEAVGQLTGGLAHDFNNLLTGISGSLELLRIRLAQGRLGDADRYIVAAQDATARAAALTHRLLAFARRQTLDPKPTNANKLIANMEDLIQRTVGPGIKIQTVLRNDVGLTLCDPNQLESALLNLCINSRDAMPDGGLLIIETANGWVDVSNARKRDMQPGQYVAVSVTDSGAGMPPEVLSRAFDPFYTTKPAGQGTGLGLSMVYGFVKQSGGQVTLFSKVFEGTTVRLYLPRFPGQADEGENHQEPMIAPRARADETVLIVDDEPTVRLLVTEVLEDLGYTTIEAADANAGLKVLRSDVRIDLLVTDVGLPGRMNGRQMADAGRERRPGLKVLFITGYSENAPFRNGQLPPGMHVLPKPFAMDALASRVRATIGES